MRDVKPLPKYLVQRYKGWKATDYAENSAWYRRLAEDGQRPRAMVISCCDSRVPVNTIFGAETGEFFVHRNVANLVPPYNPDLDLQSTSAALEYAVCSLRVAHLLVLGHSQCGGVAACDDMCRGAAPELETGSSFLGRWLDVLREGHKQVAGRNERSDRLRAFEKQAVLVSLQNALTFPYVRAAVESGSLALHALWNDIATGQLEQFDPEAREFVHV